MATSFHKLYLTWYKSITVCVRPQDSEAWMFDGKNWKVGSIAEGREFYRKYLNLGYTKECPESPNFTVDMM